MRGQKRGEDARERAYDPRIHLLREKWMDCRVKPGNDRGVAICSTCAPLGAQPAAAGNHRRRNFIASGLLFTMKAATPTCRAGEGPHVTPRCVTIRDIPYVTIRVIMRLDL